MIVELAETTGQKQRVAQLLYTGRDLFVTEIRDMQPQT